MPRTGKGRGGSRQGTPGTTYANRTDLAQRKVPVMVGPSPQYGTAVAQQRAQQAMPIAPAPSPAPPPGPGAPSPVPGPVTVTPLDAPSARPDEHVMAGVSVGPGPGPEALGPLGQTQQQGYQTATQQVTALAQQAPDNQALQYLAAQLHVRY